MILSAYGCIVNLQSITLSQTLNIIIIVTINNIVVFVIIDVKFFFFFKIENKTNRLRKSVKTIC